MMSDSTENAPSIRRVRQRDLAVENEAWIRSQLREAPYGVVATDSEGQPFINPLIFAYDEEANAIFFHTGRQGRIFSNVSANPRVCFNVCRMGELVARPAACEFGVEYDSVIVFGKARVVEDLEEARRALKLLLAKYFADLHYGQDYTPITPQQLARTAVYRLQIEAWSGKRNGAKPR
jgi:nitroimidazol reductase NimA-like FMN-containing flavoprotein (pyridoxamine 5'-phosphate oxidase superfamily)